MGPPVSRIGVAMRSAMPIEGNPWPHDMLISIADDASQVMELLWVREAWGLHPAGDVPPPLIDAPTEVRATPDADLWERVWPAMWEAVIEHAGRAMDPAVLRDLSAAPAGSPLRADLLAELVGPSWRGRFGDAAFDDRYTAWAAMLFEQRTATRPRSVGEEPERRSLTALVPAWETGLTRIVTIPCRGEHTRIISDSALLVTQTTRADPSLYSAALTSFARRADSEA